jgi:hypothetical protein
MNFVTVASVTGGTLPYTSALSSSSTLTPRVLASRASSRSPMT